MPEFQAREPEHQQWKRAVLDGEIKLDQFDLTAHAKTAVATVASASGMKRASQADLQAKANHR